MSDLTTIFDQYYVYRSISKKRELLPVFFSVRAAFPAAGSALTTRKLIVGSLQSSRSRVLLFGRIDEAYPLITSERGDVIPGSSRLGMGIKRLDEIVGNLSVHSTSKRRSIHRHIIIQRL